MQREVRATSIIRAISWVFVSPALCYIEQCCTKTFWTSYYSLALTWRYGKVQSPFTLPYLSLYISVRADRNTLHGTRSYLEIPPSAASVSCTLLSYRTGNIYDKWSQQTRLWFTSLSKHHVFTQGNQSINLCQAPRIDQ